MFFGATAEGKKNVVLIKAGERPRIPFARSD